jgi:hypothetical protein
MEFAVFRLHSENADQLTRELLDGVLKDERRHMGFGENELGRRLQVMPEVRLRIRDVRQELDRLVLSTFDATAAAIGVKTSERNELAGVYLDTVRRLGVGD